MSIAQSPVSCQLQLVSRNGFWDLERESAETRMQRANSDGCIEYHVYTGDKREKQDDAESLSGSTEDGGECPSSCESCGSISVDFNSRVSSPAPSRVMPQSAQQVVEARFRSTAAPAAQVQRRRAQDSDEKLQCQFLVGIEEESRFRVARRLLGPAGAHVKAIASETGCRLRLRGRGSKFLEGPERMESTDPLMLCVSAPGRAAYETAVQQITAILEQIYRDYQQFRSSRGRRPELLQVQLHEGPREGSC